MDTVGRGNNKQGGKQMIFTFTAVKANGSFFSGQEEASSPKEAAKKINTTIENHFKSWHEKMPIACFFSDGTTPYQLYNAVVMTVEI